MDVIGLENFLKKDKATIKDVLGMAQSNGYSLDKAFKSLILALKKIDNEKYLELKEMYLNEAVKKAEEQSLGKYDKNQIELIKGMHELEIEISKAKLEVVNKILEG